MYEVQFRGHCFDRQAEIACSILGLLTLEDAKKARKLSGDLVIDSATGRIVTNTSWLFDWELLDPTSYAHEAIKWQRWWYRQQPGWLEGKFDSDGVELL